MRSAKIIGKTDTPMPDLIIDLGYGETAVIDPFVSCVIETEEFHDDLEAINEMIDNEIIGRFCEVDLENCGINGECYFPYSKEQFKLL